MLARGPKAGGGPAHRNSGGYCTRIDKGAVGRRHGPLDDRGARMKSGWRSGPGAGLANAAGGGGSGPGYFSEGAVVTVGPFFRRSLVGSLDVPTCIHVGMDGSCQRRRALPHRSPRQSSRGGRRAFGHRPSAAPKRAHPLDAHRGYAKVWCLLLFAR